MIQVLPGQSILDICIQTSGGVESLFDLIRLNEIDDPFVLPSYIKPPGIISKAVASHYLNNGITPATTMTNSLIDFDPLDFDTNDFY